MTNSRDISGIGQPDTKLCATWVQLRDILRGQLTKLHAGSITQLQYDLSSMDISRRYGAHRLECDHPQHFNTSFGWNSSRRAHAR